MADALHSHHSQQDGNEARSGAASVSTSASILSAGELLPAVADETSAMFLQPPTISFTPATPSPPLPTPHEGLDDSVIQGLLSGGVNSLNSPPLGKAALIDPPDPLSLPGVSEGLLKADSGGNAELSDVSESSLDTLSSIVNSTSLSFREISAVAECLEQPSEVPSSSASVTDSQNQQEASSKDVEKSPTVPATDSLGKEVDGTSEPVRDLMSVNEEVEKALEPSLETIPPKELDASDWKHSFGSGGEGTNCSNGDVQDPKTNDEGHSLLPTEEPAIGTEGLELGAKEPPSPLSEFSAEFAAESQQENCLGSGSSNSEIALPLEMQNSSEDSYSLLNSTITDSSKGALTNPPSECKDVSGTDDVGKSNYLCDGDAANLSSITGNESLLSQIQDSSGRPEAMEVDEENVVQKFDELEKALEVMADMPDSSEVPSSKENSLPDFADLKDGVNKTGGDDGKEVGIVKKVSSLLLNDAEEPLQPVTIGGSLQPLEEVQEASILNDPSFTADLSLIESSADEADSIGGLVINSVIGAADGVADFPPDDEMETERQLMDISSSAPRVNHGVCEVDASEDIEPSAKRRKLENGEKEDDVLVDARSVTFKVLPVKNGHGLWDSIKLKEILLSKGTLHLRIHASSNDLETFEPEKCEIEVDFTCIMVSALEEECDSALGNSTQDPEVFDPLAIGATIGAVESNSPPHYPRPFGAQTRGRSTALQPAMPRPPYRQLQSPPHAYNKNEVLGLAQGIEFEETPGTTEWSDLSSLRSPSQEKPDFQEDSNSNSTSNQDQEQAKVNASTSKVKVCEHCGRTFEKTPAYLQHIISHRPVQQCKWCTFKSKDEKRFAQHTKSHLEVQCNICLGLFATPRTKRIHKKRIHKLYECKTCTADFTTEEEHADHLIREHSGLENRIKVEPTENETNGGTWSDVQNGGPETQEFPEPKEEKPLRKQKVKVQEAESLQKFTCYLCNEETQNKCELKIHIAQHLGVPSSKITDEDLLMGDMKPYNFSSESSQYNGKEDGLEVLGSDNPMQLMLQDLVMSNKSKLPYSNLTSPFSLNIIPQSFHSARRQDSLLGSTPTSRASGLRIKEEPGEMGPGKNEAFYDDDADFRNDDVSDDTKVSNRRTTRYSYVRRIPCDQCDAVFKSYNKLRQHEKQKHREKPTCPLCNTSRTNVKKVFQHQIAAHKNKLRCHYLCLALFDTKEEQSAHHLQVHNKDDSKLTCRYCKESYLRATFMDHLNVCEEQHVRKESPENSHACGFCETSFQTLEEYTNHIKFCGPWNKKGKEVVLNDNEPPEMPMVLRERNPTVDNTEITDDFSEDNSIDRGTLNVNAISVKVKEEICQDEETRHSPVFIKQEGMKHKCKHCSLTFEYQEDGINHVLAHHKTTLTAMTREPQMCHVCGKTFLSSLAFCKHILNHYSELGMWDSLIPPDIDMETIRNTCWICKTGGMTNHRYHAARRDNTIESLLATSSADPDGEPFNCSMCDETFPDRMLFWKHIRLHLSKSHFKNVEGGKRLKCSKCPMKFKKKSELHQHLAAHLIHSDMEEVASESENSDDDDSDSTPKSSRKRPRRDSGKRTSSCSLGVRLLSNSQPPMRRHFQKCKRCRKKFANKEEAVDHVQKYHKSVLENMVAETQICHICDKAFRKPMLLCRHLLHHYRELSMWDDLVPRNILDVSQDRRFCWICNNMLGRKASRHLNMRNTQIEQILMSNSKKLREEPEFSCTLCDATCSDRHAFWKHINLHFYKYPKKKPAIEQPVYVSTETLDCNECLLKFKDKTDLNKHMASHFLLPVVQEEDFKEENCKVKEESEEEEDEDEEEEDEDEESTAKAHSAEATSNSLRKGDPQEGMKCTRCLKVFQKTSEAVQHMMSSHKFFLMRKLEISEMCHLCGSIFKSQWCLCKHVCKHYCTLEMWDALVPKDLLEKFEYRNYCWICKCKLGRKYAHHIGKRNFNIEKILKTACTEDQEQDFVCNVCKIRFPNRLDFWMHIKTHICKPPIKAGRLGKTFASASDANSRQLKVLECSECSEKFFEEHDLYKHLASHYIKPVSKEMDVADDEEVKSEEVKGEIKNEADQEEQRATRYKRKRRQLGKKSLESREEGVPTDGRKDKGVKSLSDISLSEEEWVPSPHEEEEEGEEDDEEDADGGEEPENSNVVRGESEMSDVRKDSGNDNFSKKNVEDGTGDCDDDDDDDEEEGEDEEMEEEEEEEEEDMNEDMEDEELLGDEIEEEEEDADDELEETGEEVESDLEEEEDDEEDSDY